MIVRAIWAQAELHQDVAAVLLGIARWRLPHSASEISCALAERVVFRRSRYGLQYDLYFAKFLVQRVLRGAAWHYCHALPVFCQFCSPSIERIVRQFSRSGSSSGKSAGSAIGRARTFENRYISAL